MISAIVLASGYSKRFKKNKLMVLIEGIPLVERVLREVCLSNADEIIFVYREDKVKKIGEKYNCKCVYNKFAEDGMSESIKLGIKASSENTNGYIFFVGDQVFLNKDVIDGIIDCSKQNKEDIIIPRCSGKRSNPICFPKKYKNELLKLTGDVGGRKIIDALSDGKQYYEIEDEEFCIDLDTIDDIKHINSKLKKR